MNSQSLATRMVVPVLVLAAFSVPLIGVGARQAVRSNANDVRDWLPAHYSETKEFRHFQEHFGSDDFVVVSWPGCTLEDARLDQYARWLTDRSADRKAAGDPQYFTRVRTGRELVDQLTAEPIMLSRREAIRRLTGVVIGPDGKQTCAVVTLEDVPHRNLHAMIGELKNVAAAVGVQPADIHVGGPPVVNAAIDRSSTQSLIRLAGVAGLIGLVVAWLCFRTVRLTVIVFLVAMYSAALSLAIVPLCGVPMNAILVTMVPLVYVAAMSGAIHLSNYYLDVRRTGRSNPIGRALVHAALPLGLATGTTAVGLLSLEYSDLLPIRLFGLFSAIGVSVALLVQFTLLPALLAFWPAPESETAGAKTDGSDNQIDEEHEVAAPLSPGWQRLVDVVVRRNGWVSAACLLLLVLGAVGLTKVDTSIQIMRLFSPETPIIASYAWLEEKLGALVPMEIVLRFDANDQSSMAQRLSLVRQVQENVVALPDVGGSLSAATFAPALPRASARSLRSFMVNRRLMLARPELIKSGYLASGQGEELWRVSLRVNAVKDIDYKVFQKQLASVVDPVLEKSSGGTKVEAIYTGAVPIIYQARHSLLDGLALGFGTDIALIVIAVMVVALVNAIKHYSNSTLTLTGSVLSSGVLMLLASVFPMTLVFGLMGWTGTLVDIGSIMTPCVALGVTVDDIIHFLLWFRRGIEGGHSPEQSVRLAYQGCGRAMVQSWGVIGLGLAAFALSSFVPTFRFGALMIGLLTVGLVGNLLFLPALLAGPLGRIIAGGMKRKIPAESDEDSRAEVAAPHTKGRRPAAAESYSRAT